MNEMVDRLAAVLAKAFGDDWDICLKAPGLRKAGMYRTIARSMIVAMREPTDAMLEIAQWSSVPYASSRDADKIKWQAMCDEALK